MLALPMGGVAAVDVADMVAGADAAVARADVIVAVLVHNSPQQRR